MPYGKLIMGLLHGDKNVFMRTEVLRSLDWVLLALSLSKAIQDSEGNLPPRIVKRLRSCKLTYTTYMSLDIPYLTVRTEEVRMVNQDVVEDSGHSRKWQHKNKKHCHYYLVDRLPQPQTLKNSAAVQEYLAVELGLRKSYILVGSRLPRGGWESWIDNRKCLESVIKLPRGGRSTRRPDQQPIIHAKTCSEDQDQQQRVRQERSENLDQVPFNESEWAQNPLLH